MNQAPARARRSARQKRPFRAPSGTKLGTIDTLARMRRALLIHCSTCRAETEYERAFCYVCRQCLRCCDCGAIDDDAVIHPNDPWPDPRD